MLNKALNNPLEFGKFISPKKTNQEDYSVGETRVPQACIYLILTQNTS
jgi:hypothetical protein